MQLVSPQTIRPGDEFVLFGLRCTVVATALLEHVTSIHFKVADMPSTGIQNLTLHNVIGFPILP